MAGRPKKYTADQMVTALTETRGMVTLAARRLGCDVKTVRRYIREFPTVAQAQRDETEYMGDRVELELYNQALGKHTKDGTVEREPNLTALIFLAKTKFKSRGYTEKLEIDINIELVQRTVQALEAAGLDVAATFEKMIQKAHDHARPQP